MAQLKHLFQPIKIGNVEIRNRVEMAPVTDNFGVDDYVTERMKAFYEERAKGGVGLINIGFFTVNYPHNPLGIGMYDDRFTPGIRELTDLCHKHGAKVGVELNFEENYTKTRGGPFELIGPSSVVPRPGKAQPRPLTIEEIEEIVEQWGDAAVRAREGGFDTVHIIAHAGYPLAQFLSPFTNRRTDKYGGSFENRLRIIMEIIESIKKKAGADYTLTARIGGGDFMRGGLSLGDTVKIAQRLEELGVSMLNVTTGWHDSATPFIQYYVPKANWTYFAETVKRFVKIPVATGTRILDPVLADRIIGEGKADMVYFARPLIADSFLLEKAMKGKYEEIVPCTSCCLCFDRWAELRPICCQVNARAGFELERNIVPADRPKKVLVAGGGAAGMEAARVAALRGHKVTLLEKGDRLGGALNVGSIPPGKDGVGQFRDYLVRELKRVGVEVKLNTMATRETISTGNPDEIIVATGAVPVVPNIPGVDGKNVFLAADVITGKKKVGKKVVIIGGGMVGCEAADLLAEQGKAVTILEMMGKIAVDVGRTTKWVIRQRLGNEGVEVETKAKVTKITGEGVVAQLNDGSTHLYRADSVVIAVGYQEDKKLANELGGSLPNVHVIGDCAQRAKIHEAVEAGFVTASQI
ncbi:MAG: FAD-dependent oxidoreductase [Chloroflexota bacterium]